MLEVNPDLDDEPPPHWLSSAWRTQEKLALLDHFAEAARLLISFTDEHITAGDWTDFHAWEKEHERMYPGSTRKEYAR